MDKLKYFKRIRSFFDNPAKEVLDLALNNVHHKGLFSLVVNGTEFGKLTRIFIAKNKIKPYAVQLHTHRYPIKLTVIKGCLIQYTASLNNSEQNSNNIELSQFEYKSPLNGGNGLKYITETNVLINQFTIPVGGSIYMTSDEYHTVSCDKNTMWIVEELGFEKESSLVLGVPFVLENLYTKPNAFTVNDNYQLCKKELDTIIYNYLTV